MKFMSLLRMSKALFSGTLLLGHLIRLKNGCPTAHFKVHEFNGCRVAEKDRLSREHDSTGSA